MPSVKHHWQPLGRHYFKEWREFRGLDQEEAAQRLGISRTQLSKIENQKSPYSQHLLERAAEVYDCTVGDLVMPDPLSQELPRSIVDSLKKASAATREQIRAVVETLLKTGT
jgi:transcriptional regulator with XRE-family HTH domain